MSDIADRLRNWRTAYLAETGPNDDLMVAFLNDCAEAATFIEVATGALRKIRGFVYDFDAPEANIADCAEIANAALGPSVVSQSSELSSLRARVGELEAELTFANACNDSADKLCRALNGLDIDDADKRAEWFMQSWLDGFVSEGGRAQVKIALAEHFRSLLSRTLADKGGGKDLIQESSSVVSNPPLNP